MITVDCHPLLRIPGSQGIFHFLARTVGLGGDSWCHLLPGKDRALLVDTGFGVGNLRALCESCTDLPIDVVNTHFHADHSGGNSQFERVHIHGCDASLLEARRRTEPAGLRTVTPVAEIYFFTEDDVIQPKPYEILPLKDGHGFDLGGGYEYEVFHLPGHSPGGIAILDRKRRMLFSGDAIVHTPVFLEKPLAPGIANAGLYTIEAFRDGLKRLCAHVGEFDAIYPGHSHQGLEPEFATDMLACAEELLAGDTSVQATADTGNHRGIPLHIHGRAKIAFSPGRMRVEQVHGNKDTK